MEIFRKVPNKRCLNGLAFDYELSVDLDTDHLADNLQAAFPEKLIRLEESLGPRRVVRLILKFVMECRLGERDQHVGLIHRMSAKEQRREETEQHLENTLRRLAAEKVELAHD